MNSRFWNNTLNYRACSIIYKDRLEFPHCISYIVYSCSLLTHILMIMVPDSLIILDHLENSLKFMPCVISSFIVKSVT